MKYRYNQCKYGGIVDKKEAIKVGSYYYHKECYKEKMIKKRIEEQYYNKFQNKERIQIVRKAINDYINKYNYEPKYILFVLNKNIKLNSIFGLIYYLKNDEYKKEFNKLKAKLVKFDASQVEIENSKNIIFKRKQRKLWGDFICKENYHMI